MTPGEILSVTAEDFHIAVADILSRKRTRAVADARMMAMLVMRDLLPHSSIVIGNIFSRTHATVLHDVKKIRDYIDTEPQMLRHYKNIMEKLILQ